MKKIIALFGILLIYYTNSFAAGTDSSTEVIKPSSYQDMLKLIKNEKYNEALQGLEKILEQNKYKQDPDILTHYAFVLRKTKNFKKSEEYYNKALNIDPQHRGALEYLGELYVDTQRSNLAKEVLKKLENCRCQEYSELKNYINK